jgi:hypothetical protein
MRYSFLVSLFLFLSIFRVVPGADARPAAEPNRPFVLSGSGQGDASSPAEETVVIPGPLRSFLRMAGVSQEVTPPEVLPTLARSVILHGYHNERPMEFLILLRRYYHQSQELGAQAGPNAKIQVDGCKNVEPLLHILGYRMQGECGHTSLTLITADAERAFLTIDSGFPLLDLEEALQKGTPFTYDYAGSAVPVIFAPSDWTALNTSKGQNISDMVEALIYEPHVARLYWALSQTDPETRAALKKDVGLGKLAPFAPVLNLYGSQLCIRSGTVVVPGGQKTEKGWQELVGASPKTPSEFIPHLLKKDHGWLAAYFDALARTGRSQQEHFATGDRLKLYYNAFRSPGTSQDAAASMAFRPAPALLVLTSRMRWDSNGAPYVPGNLQVWNEVISSKANHKIFRDWGKRSSVWSSPDQLAEALFTLARQETDSGPVQAYLCLTELDHRRQGDRRLGTQAVALLATKFAEFGDQYLIFSEFPELTDTSITQFLTTAENIDKISDHALRGNTMGTFQANVGLWQILARQGEIERSQLNSSWQEVIKPFGRFGNSAQLLTAGRRSFEQLFRVTTGKAGGSQEEMIDLLAGVRQTSSEGQRIHREIAGNIRSVLQDQRLVSTDTLFALDDGLKQSEPAANKDALLTLASELRDFEMPQPIFTNSERTRWAAGIYNNSHTDAQMHTDLAKVISSPSTPEQRDKARGRLATFMRDTLVGMNYAYYEPPSSQVLHNNPLFVRSHDFAGESVIGTLHLWQSAELFGAGSPAGGGAHLIGSLADLSYVMAQTEQDFIAPDHVQALIWQQFVPSVLSNAIVSRWWNVSPGELHAVALYQRAGEELLAASAQNEELRGKVMFLLSDRMFPSEGAWLEQSIRTGKTSEALSAIMPADSFYLSFEFSQRYPGQLGSLSTAARELETLSREDPEAVNQARLSRDFGVIHPVLVQTSARELLNVKPFPAMGGTYSRLMGECWDSGNLYWARLADEMHYPPVLLNRMVPELTHRMVERIFASEFDDWPAVLRALQETGEEFRQGKISPAAPERAKLDSNSK